MDVFEKQPGETINYTLDFSQSVDVGDTIVAEPSPQVTITNVKPFTDDEPPVVELVTLNTIGKSVKVLVSGGVNAQTYMIRCVVHTQGGEVLEGDAKLKIKGV